MDSLREIALRIVCAAAAGIILGANRWLHHKSAGVKTHALVAIGGAAAVLGVTRGGSDAATAADLSVDAVSRVFQGLMTGVGFLGAGVIIHNASGNRIQGLTTAASIWITTILGAVIGMGHVMLAMTAVLAAGIVLLVGNGIERVVGDRFEKKRTDGATTHRPEAVPVRPGRATVAPGFARGSSEPLRGSEDRTNHRPFEDLVDPTAEKER